MKRTEAAVGLGRLERTKLTVLKMLNYQVLVLCMYARQEKYKLKNYSYLDYNYHVFHISIHCLSKK